MKNLKTIARRRLRIASGWLESLRFRFAHAKLWELFGRETFWRQIANALSRFLGGSFIFLIGALYIAGVYATYVLAQKTFGHKWSEVSDIEAAKVFFPTLIAVIGGPVLIWRVITSHIQAKAAQLQAKTGKEEHYTDIFAKAVEQLGATREVVETIEIKMEPPLPPQRQMVTTTEPNLEVRLGAIYSLERIAQDSQRDHWPIMEVLCAYIRNPQNSGRPISRPETSDGRRKWPASIPPSRLDIQAAIKVIGRRNTRWKEHEQRSSLKLDFRNANLQKVVFDGGDFTVALFGGAHLEGASFTACQLNGCSFTESILTQASFTNSTLKEADFSSAKLDAATLTYSSIEGASFKKAWLWQASFVVSQLSGANFSESTGNEVNFSLANLDNASLRDARLRQAKFNGSMLRTANLESADLSAANFETANLDGTEFFECNLKAASFTNAKMSGTSLDKSDCSFACFYGADMKETSLEETLLKNALLFNCNLNNSYFLNSEQLDGAHGDSTTMLPVAIQRPATWPNEELPAKERKILSEGLYKQLHLTGTFF